MPLPRMQIVDGFPVAETPQQVQTLMESLELPKGKDRLAVIYVSNFLANNVNKQLDAYALCSSCGGYFERQTMFAHPDSRQVDGPIVCTRCLEDLVE